MSGDCNFKNKLLHGKCEKHWQGHGCFKIGFWSFVTSVFVVISVIIAGDAYVNSPEYTQEKQEWQYLTEKAGCNDLKYRMDEILAKKSRDRSFHEDKVLDYIQERYTWSCSSDVVALGK